MALFEELARTTEPGAATEPEFLVRLKAAPALCGLLTWHLHGSLPQARYPPPQKLNSGQAFVWMDRYLDSACRGPLYLRDERIARIVITCLRRGVELGHYDLGPYVLMGNHVHVLLFPRVPPPRLLRALSVNPRTTERRGGVSSDNGDGAAAPCALKGATAREVNLVLRRTGEPFWQGETYDHWVRDDQEMERIEAYIENNPVKAGLVARPEDHPWSSAAERAASAGTSPGAAGTSARATGAS